MSLTKIGGNIATLLAAVALTAKYFVMGDGNICGADKKAWGVVDADTASGEYAPVQVDGIALVIAGGAITVTDEPVPVASDASGKAVAATALSATVPSTGTTVTSSSAQPAMTMAGSYTPQAINGYAIDPGTYADGDVIRIKVV